MDKLLAELLEDISTDIGLNNSDDAKMRILSSKIKNAIREVKNFIVSDLNDLYSNIRALALYDWNKRGVEGQSSHSSNGTSRGYDDRAKCFNGIIPFADIV